jgi:hypothetical protein
MDGDDPQPRSTVVVFFGMINGHDQIPFFLNLNHTLRHFEASVIGIS